MQLINIAVLGITGKMGQLLAELIHQSQDLQLTGGTTSLTSPLQGHLMYGVQIHTDISAVCKTADLLIDFSSVASLATHVDQALIHKKPLLIGTTGLQPEHYALLQEAGQTIPLFYASNTSLGVTLLSTLVRYAAQHLDMTYDIEIHETHHRDKIDAPSGTALQLGRAAAKGRGVDFEAVKSLTQSGKRPQGAIGFSCTRGGQVVAEHTVRFLGDEEVIELSHKGLDRRLYAKGALKAARWLLQQGPGFYTMQDMVHYEI